MELMTLRTMCERLNVSRRSIQCYEQAGLLKPSAKNKYGHLLYDEQAFQRAQMIRFLQQLGFKLEEVKEIIDAPDNVRKDAMEVHVRMLECETEKMACFTEEGETVGAISYASNFDFLPSTHGVLIHFNCEEIEQTLEKVLLKGGKVVIPRTKIEADGKGWFAVFTDSEGNRIGVYAEK